MTRSVPRRVVYTILFGDYEQLLAQPMLRDSAIDAICFTDSAELTSDEWKIVRVPRRVPGDVVRSQREVKTRFARYLGEYDEVLYLDNTVRLKALPEVVLDEWLEDSDMTLIEHSFRNRLIDEFDEVARLHYDDAVRVHEQLWDYATVYPRVLEGKPLWTGLMARRNIAAVNEAMEIWYEQILRYSRRDQLSVAVALAGGGFRLRTLQRENSESEWHTWALSDSRRVSQGKRPPLPAGPPVADLLRIEGASAELQAENARLQRLVDELGAEVEAVRAESAGIREAGAADKRVIEGLSAQLREMEQSTSWKVTSPVRRLFSGIRRRS